MNSVETAGSNPMFSKLKSSGKTEPRVRRDTTLILSCVCAQCMDVEKDRKEVREMVAETK